MNSGIYTRARIEARLRNHPIENAFRIIWRRHEVNLLDPKPRKSRFSDGSFAVLYAASNFETALLETIVRDRFVRVNRRVINAPEHIQGRIVAMLGTKSSMLNLVDLRDAGIVELGAPTDALRARNQQAGQSLGLELFRQHHDVDGLIYPSRFDGNTNFAIFDRAINKLNLLATVELGGHPGLADALKRWEISVVDN